MKMELKAHSYDITLKDDAVDRNGDTHLEIQLWCFDQDSQPCLVRVRDFPVLCKMELPVSTDKYGNVINWDEDNSGDLLVEIRNYMNNKDIEPFSHSSYQRFTRFHDIDPISNIVRQDVSAPALCTILKLSISKILRFINLICSKTMCDFPWII